MRNGGGDYRLVVTPTSVYLILGRFSSVSLLAVGMRGECLIQSDHFSSFASMGLENYLPMLFHQVLMFPSGFKYGFVHCPSALWTLALPPDLAVDSRKRLVGTHPPSVHVATEVLKPCFFSECLAVGFEEPSYCCWDTDERQHFFVHRRLILILSFSFFA